MARESAGKYCFQIRAKNRFVVVFALSSGSFARFCKKGMQIAEDPASLRFASSADPRVVEAALRADGRELKRSARSDVRIRMF